MKRLNFLLDRSSIYAKILTEKLQKQQEEAREAALRSEEALRKKREAVAMNEGAGVREPSSDATETDEAHDEDSTGRCAHGSPLRAATPVGYRLKEA